MEEIEAATELEGLRTLQCRTLANVRAIAAFLFQGDLPTLMDID